MKYHTQFQVYNTLTQGKPVAGAYKLVQGYTLYWIDHVALVEVTVSSGNMWQQGIMRVLNYTFSSREN